MTLTDLQALVFNWLDDSDGIRTGTGGYYSNTIVTQWLNLAAVEVQKLLIRAGDNWYIRCQSAITVIQQREYGLPSDFLRSFRLELTTSGTGTDRSVVRLRPMSLNQQDRVGKGVGLPAYWILKKNSFELYPAPNAAYEMDLFYAPRLTAMASGTDVPDCPDEYQELIAILATFNGFIKDDRVASMLQTKKMEYLASIKIDAEERQADEPRQVIMTDDDDAGTFLF